MFLNQSSQNKDPARIFGVILNVPSLVQWDKSLGKLMLCSHASA
jgi:hypothetical protein